MRYTEHGFKQGFLAALNRCVAASFFTAPQGTDQNEKDRSSSEIPPRMVKRLARERYLAIPTFIRQGKTLGL